MKVVFENYNTHPIKFTHNEATCKKKKNTQVPAVNMGYIGQIECRKSKVCIPMTNETNVLNFRNVALKASSLK